MSRFRQFVWQIQLPLCLKNRIYCRTSFVTAKISTALQAPQFPSGWTTIVNRNRRKFCYDDEYYPILHLIRFLRRVWRQPGLSELISPPILVSGVNSVLTFRNRYSLENTWDGAVLEIKIGNGNFQDIIDAGGTFISGGYTTLLNPSTNPLANRFAWSGAIQTPYITSSVQTSRFNARAKCPISLAFGFE